MVLVFVQLLEATFILISRQPLVGFLIHRLYSRSGFVGCLAARLEVSLVKLADWLRFEDCLIGQFCLERCWKAGWEELVL
jgi:hypothetical protein